MSEYVFTYVHIYIHMKKNVTTLSYLVCMKTLQNFRNKIRAAGMYVPVTLPHLRLLNSDFRNLFNIKSAMFTIIAHNL